MRRLLLLALLAPAVAAAAPPTPGTGQITFETVLHSDTDGYINLAECASGSIALSWSPSFFTSIANASFANTASYTLYVSNTEPGDSCFTQNDTTNNVVAGPILTITANLSNPMTSTFDTALIATVAGQSCSGTSDSDIFLCIQARDSGNTNIGVARLKSDGTSAAKLVLSRGRPPAPTNLGASPGEQAANVSWSAGSGTTASDTYRIDATFGTTTVSSPRVTSTSYRLGGLTNDQVWTLKVISFSVAGNPNDQINDPSPTTTVVPSHVLDFYAEYQAAGGREQGGCAGGPAGAAALVAVAAGLLVVRRRRKQ